ncbi:Hpt domain-containing protein [Kordiimonas lipolytica]|uniref:Hpt domain-containing protein n=1 Tax=Kordiimonas lipolytica TaxID=1662421 RepID=A0ABV8UCN9_9PROT|nr:Hpt domain-containing protein [Kordiimonas lipolytica]
MGGQIPLLDMPVLDRLAAEVGKESAAFLLDSLKQEIRNSGCELMQHASVGDLEQLEIQAHALKSAARSFGAMRLGEACQAIEYAAKADGSPEIEGLLSQFQIISEETLEAFNQAN